MARIGMKYFLIGLLFASTVAILAGWLHWNTFEREHLTYLATDQKTGLELSSFCKYGGLSFRTYVRIRYGNAKGDSDIFVQEVPRSADTLSDCTKEPHYVVRKLEIDADFKYLTVSFRGDQRENFQIPLNLAGLDIRELQMRQVINSQKQ